MQRTYYIKYPTIHLNEYGERFYFQKVVYKSDDERPSWHKVGALNEWQRSHKGYGRMTIGSVFTIAEMKKLYPAYIGKSSEPLDFYHAHM